MLFHVSAPFHQYRFDVAALNFRGCSGELSRYPIGYHLGFTDDLLHVVGQGCSLPQRNLTLCIKPFMK